MDGVTVEGREHLVQKDGTFHVDEATGKSMLKSGIFTQVGVNFQNARGHLCKDCGRVNVFRNRCGRCGGTNLEPES